MVFLLHHLQHPAGWLSQGFFLFSFPPLRSFPTGNWAWTTVGGGEGKSKHGILLQLPFFPPRLICPCHVYRAHSNGFHTDKRRQKKIYGSSTQMSVIPLADALCEKGIYSHASKISWVNFGGLWVSDSHTIRPSHAWAYPYTHSTYCACITSGHPSSLATTTLSLESAARLALPRSRSTLRAAPRRCGPSLQWADRSSWKEEASTSAVTVWGGKIEGLRCRQSFFIIIIRQNVSPCCLPGGTGWSRWRGRREARRRKTEPKGRPR